MVLLRVLLVTLLVTLGRSSPSQVSVLELADIDQQDTQFLQSLLHDSQRVQSQDHEKLASPLQQGSSSTFVAGHNQDGELRCACGRSGGDVRCSCGRSTQTRAGKKISGMLQSVQCECEKSYGGNPPVCYCKPTLPSSGLRHNNNSALRCSCGRNGNDVRCSCDTASLRSQSQSGTPLRCACARRHGALRCSCTQEEDM